VHTCRLGHEQTDALMYANWGIDFIKLDLGCRSDTSIHDGTAIAALERVRDGLNATGRPILFYIDAGNPTAGPRVYNPMHRGMPVDLFTKTHVANALDEAVWSWGPAVGHTWKIWFDRNDQWESLIENVYRQVGLEWYVPPPAPAPSRRCRTQPCPRVIPAHRFIIAR
jgi:alpha-galactosidase